MEEKMVSDEGGNNALVKSELEAAEALAGLARSEASFSGEKTEESPPQQHDSVSDWTAALRLSSDSTEEIVGNRSQCEDLSTITLNMDTVDQNTQFYKTSATPARAHPYISGSKSRPKLTEEEKEARKIRRVLANRESARQTIRRRQAIYEELITKAEGLTQENERLNKEMEFAVTEYNSMKITNESLKLQMFKSYSTEIEETRDLIPTNSDTAISTRPSCPFVVYNQNPHFPFIWPAFLPPRNAKANFENNDVPNHPLYILPCPVFYPVPDHGAGIPLMPSFESYSYAGSSSTQTVEYAFEESKGEASSSKTTLDVPIKCQTSQPMLVKPTASVSIIASQQADPTSSPSTLSKGKERKLDLNACPNKKQVDTAAAAEARKRRKELTKLKSIHNRDIGNP